MSSKMVSIAVEGGAKDELKVETEENEKKRMFLEKRKTCEFHEYPAHPVPANEDDEEEDCEPVEKCGDDDEDEQQ